MSFDKNFCPSPWFHTRINNTGHYEYCRWAAKDARRSLPNIREVSPIEWFQTGMAPIRQALLDGEELAMCRECHVMEQHGKVSGRQKQLLKIGVTKDVFVKTMLSSPWVSPLRQSQATQGETRGMVQDWQIDLGNFCNSACLFCDPYSSSRLASEHKKLNIITQVPPPPWCDDDELLQSFIKCLRQSDHIAYLHFIGGETLITPAFRTILRALVDQNLSKDITIGFTTNLTCWDDDIVDLLRQFSAVNLGMSVECLHPVNDYVRYGSRLATVQEMLSRWIDVGRAHNWYLQIRTTPTILSIGQLHTVYEFAMQNKIPVESCNFLNDPSFMRPSVLPWDLRQVVIDKLKEWLSQHDATTSDQIINIRNPDFVAQQILQDANSYVKYLSDEPDESHRLPDLVSYLKLMDGHRKNTVLEYLPEYAELFRSSGY